MEKNYDYLIIGGGISGLHLGALLSQHGRVIIFEKSHELGGRARVETIENFKLDYGVHPIRFGPNSALGTSLIELEKSISFIKPGRSWAFLANGKKTIFPTGGLMAIVRSSMVPFISTLRLLLKIRKMEEKELKELYDLSLEKWFERENIRPELRKFLIMASSAIQVNPFPERSSIGELLHNIKRVLEIGSVYYPKGGWETLFSQFVDAIKENDGIIRKNSKVQKIVVKNGTAVGVKVKDDIISANTIISTIPVQKLFSILDEKLCDKDIVKKCKNLRPTAGISIDFLLERKVSEIDGMIFFDDPFSFGFIPSNLSPEITPKGKSLMSFLRIVNVEDIGDKNKRDKLYREFRGNIMKWFPDIKTNLIEERPLFLDMVDGVEVNVNQHKYNRINHSINGISNFWMCGDSTGGEGAGGDVGHTSVRECYEKITKS